MARDLLCTYTSYAVHLVSARSETIQYGHLCRLAGTGKLQGMDALLDAGSSQDKLILHGHVTDSETM